MKLINGAELRKCPAGTLYQKYVHFPELNEMLTHRAIGGLVAKGLDAKHKDTFFCMPLSGIHAVDAVSLDDSIEKFQTSKETGESMAVSLNGWCHADIGDNEYVMVWEPADVALLIGRLQGLDRLCNERLEDDE